MNKTVLVTGACINTGVAIVEKFAREGWNVAFTGRNCERVDEAEARYASLFPHVRILGYAIDSLKEDHKVNEDGVEAVLADLEGKGLRVSALVLNAADQGINMKIFENPLQDFLDVVNTNMTWNYCWVEHAARRMKEDGEGSVVFINSNTAYRAIPNRIAYSASKGGQLGMMRALALDLGRFRIRVNAVLPGMIRTDRWEKNPEWYASVPSAYTPLGDVANGEDIAEAAYYLTANARNATGAELVVDGGNSIQLYPITPDQHPYD